MSDPDARTMTVADVLRTHPNSPRVFARHHIDFCCKAYRTVAEAAGDAHLTAGELVSELEDEERMASGADAVVDWSERPAAELIAHILEHHHQPLVEELPRLAALARKVAAVHGGPLHAAVLERLIAVVEDLQPHMRKEERILFPLILSNDLRASGPIAAMHDEHELIGVLLGELRQVTGGYAAPEHACGSWRALWNGRRALEAELMQHIHLENNILFRRVAERAALAKHN
jgi:regulator of cell morphogenesis and NO signaling